MGPLLSESHAGEKVQFGGLAVFSKPHAMMAIAVMPATAAASMPRRVASTRTYLSGAKTQL